MNIPKPLFITLLVLLNAVPVYGVFQWGWKSFDLIFLYWLENLIIGVFMILRIVARRYSHPIELALPLFLAPFFTLHYGLFSYGHGTFIINLFGKGLEGELAGMHIPEIILPLIESRHLFWPVLALFAYQLIDWIRDTSERGFGSDGIKDLTTAPYRRILVLHITILASGFALGAMDEPLTGLLLLIIFKTGMDIYHWDKDEKAAAPKDIQPVMNEKIKKRIDAFLDKPTITVNGEEIRYNNFDEMKASKHYNLMRSIVRMVGGGKHMQDIEAYIEQQAKQRDI
ncbi:DUF6498-containing protein [Sulfuriflexus mobilis]|uniref:DUF6498-containing protein n=1 Tax=Sulfuriflexus mobilis TaxID=1811807 RepID=UPI000F81AAAE|nr:DUF6498-containing protein [Sulfuriflexus mobilis]